MAEAFTHFDAATYLTTDEGIAAFLDAAAEGNDAAHLAQALATVARARNMSQIARDAGITREGLYKALAPGANPAFATMVQIAGALGLRVAFVPQILPDRSGSADGEL